MDYRALYLKLFAACADAVEQLESANYGNAHNILVRAQQSAEDDYLSATDDNEPSIIHHTP